MSHFGTPDRDIMIHDAENLIPLMLFFVAVYWFFRWVVYDLNRSAG